MVRNLHCYKQCPMINRLKLGVYRVSSIEHQVLLISWYRLSGSTSPQSFIVVCSHMSVDWSLLVCDIRIFYRWNNITWAKCVSHENGRYTLPSLAILQNWRQKESFYIKTIYKNLPSNSVESRQASLLTATLIYTGLRECVTKKKQ